MVDADSDWPIFLVRLPKGVSACGSRRVLFSRTVRQNCVICLQQYSSCRKGMSETLLAGIRPRWYRKRGCPSGLNGVVIVSFVRFGYVQKEDGSVMGTYLPFSKAL